MYKSIAVEFGRRAVRSTPEKCPCGLQIWNADFDQWPDLYLARMDTRSTETSHNVSNGHWDGNQPTTTEGTQACLPFRIAQISVTRKEFTSQGFRPLPQPS